MNMANVTFIGILAWLGKWIWGFISYPVFFGEHLSLLKEIKERMDAPEKLKAHLDLQKEVYGYHIEKVKQKLEEKQNEISKVKDEEREKQEKILVDLEQAKRDVSKLIGEVDKLNKEKAEWSERAGLLFGLYEERRKVAEELAKRLRAAKFGKFPRRTLLTGEQQLSAPKAFFSTLSKVVREREQGNQ